MSLDNQVGVALENALVSKERERYALEQDNIKLRGLLHHIAFLAETWKELCDLKTRQLRSAQNLISDVDAALAKTPSLDGVSGVIEKITALSGMAGQSEIYRQETLRWQQEVAKLRDEIAKAEERLRIECEQLDSTSAACAKMRDFIENVADVQCNCGFHQGHKPDCRIVASHDCLADDCGKPLLDRLAGARALLLRHHQTDGWAQDRNDWLKGEP